MRVKCAERLLKSIKGSEAATTEHGDVLFSLRLLLIFRHSFSISSWVDSRAGTVHSFQHCVYILSSSISRAHYTLSLPGQVNIFEIFSSSQTFASFPIINMSKYILASLAAAGLVAGHGYVTNGTIGGVSYEFYQPYTDVSNTFFTCLEHGLLVCLSKILTPTSPTPRLPPSVSRVLSRATVLSPTSPLLTSSAVVTTWMVLWAPARPLCTQMRRPVRMSHFTGRCGLTATTVPW